MLELAKEYNFNMKYFDELKRSMEYLGKKKDTIFIGQAVEVAGTAMSNTLRGVSKNKLIELPVAEEMQMGMTLGLAMDGNIPISIFPRWNFLLYGMNQLINHIDKYSVMTGKEENIKIIIRTGVGSQRPLHPQHQHIGDFTESIKKMCTTIDVIKLMEPEDIFPAYEKAFTRTDGRNTLIVEFGDYYNEK
mgnify:FL=1